MFNRACHNDPALELQSACEEYSFTLPLQQGLLNLCNEILKSTLIKTFHLNRFKYGFTIAID